MVTRAPKLHVLIVDHNRDAADSLAVLLRFFDFEASAAYDGREGVAQAIALKPAAVILDIDMPVMDGYEAARSIRKSRSTCNAVLVALSARDAPDDMTAAARAGFDVHMTKPALGTHLADLLNVELAKRGVHH